MTVSLTDVRTVDAMELETDSVIGSEAEHFDQRDDKDVIFAKLREELAAAQKFSQAPTKSSKKSKR